MDFRTRDGRHIEICTDHPCKFCALDSDGCTLAQTCTFCPNDGLLVHLGLTPEEVVSPSDHARSAVRSPTKGDVPDPTRNPAGSEQGTLLEVVDDG